MSPEELKNRTKIFAISVFRYLDTLPRKLSTNIIANQLGRSVTSVPANYRPACRGRSRAEFLSKINLVEEESDESHFWLLMLKDLNEGEGTELNQLINEANQLTAIFTATGKSTKAKAKH
jgi:four helix bundle protein